MKTIRTKRSLLVSVLSLVLCCAMLAGTTFAWFTDEVSGVGNKIKTGTLKVDLIHVEGDEETSLKANPEHAVFDYENWEPGYTAVETLRIENQGSLAFKYQLTINTHVDNLADVELAKVIEVWVMDGTYATEGKTWDETDGWTYKGTLYEVMYVNDVQSDHTTVSGSLSAGGNRTFTLALHMMEEAGNEYQDLDLGAMFITLDAAQQTEEEDAFNNQYDAAAPLVANVYSVEEMQEALLEGKSVRLMKDLTATADDKETIPCASNGNGTYNNWAVFNVIGPSEVVIDLNGHTVTYEGHSTDFCNKQVIALFYVNNGGHMTITGNGTVEVNGMASAVYSVAVGSKAIVENGAFIGNACEVCDAFNIFMYASHGGELYIKGGSFSQSGLEDSSIGSVLVVEHGSTNPAIKNEEALVNYSKTDVVISGGSFYGMDPTEAAYCDQAAWSNQNWSQTNTVAEGYAVCDLGNGWYNVVSEDEIVGNMTYTSGEITLEDEVVVNKTQDGDAVKAEGANTVVTINGGYYDGGDNGSNTAVWARNGAKVVINDGTFSVGGSCATIYASGEGSLVEINGGFFLAGEKYFDNYFTLNLNDADAKSETGARIVVKGGTFVNFDPSKAYTEPASVEPYPYNYVADGYTVVADTQANGDIWYTVVAD